MTTLLLLALMGPQAMAPAPDAESAPIAAATAAAAVPTDDRLEAQAIWLIELQRLPSASLEPFLNDPRASVRARATLALARLKDAAALPRLVTLCGDADLTVREHAAFAGLPLADLPPTRRRLGRPRRRRPGARSALGLRGWRGRVP